MNRSFTALLKPAFFIGCGSICAYAGTWQIHRREAKKDYIALVNNRISSDPIPCPTRVSPNILVKRQYTKVKVTGVPDFKKEIVVGPASPPQSSGIRGYGRVNDFGGFVYTPIRITADNRIIILNRGWIPHEVARECNEKEEYFNEDGTMTFIGYLSTYQEPQTQIQSNENFKLDLSQIFWPFLSKKAMNEHWDCNWNENESPIIVNVFEPSTKPRGEEWPQRVQLTDAINLRVSPAQHLSYIGIWYSMAALFFYYSYLFIRNPRATQLFGSPLKRKIPRLSRTYMQKQPEKKLKL